VRAARGGVSREIESVLPKLLTGDRRLALVALLVNGALQALAMAATALGVRAVFDGWILGLEYAGLPAPALAAVLIAAYLAIAALRMHERVVAERLGQSYVGTVRLALFDRLGRLPPRVIHARSRGGHLLRFVGDLSALRQWVSLGLARMLVAGVALVATLAVLAWISVPIATAVACVLVLVTAGILALGPGIRAAAREARRRRARLAGNVNELIGAMGTVQVFGQLGRERSRLSRQSRRLRTAMVQRARWLGALRAVTEAGAGFATVAVLAAGAFGVGTGTTTPGAVVAAMTVLGLWLPMLRDLSRAHEYWNGYVVARENIVRVMDDDAQGAALLRGRDRLRAGAGELRLEELSVGRELRSVSARALPGQRVALVGGNGAGKSTLLAVVARLLDADEGRVLIDGVDIESCRLNAVRRAVGLVGPDLPLLRGSLERNLRYRDPDASPQQLARVMALTGVDRLAARLPRGLAARITDGGANLSLGERQRVALARALLGEPRILLLDEVDAHLDARAGRDLDRALDSFPGTVLIVTHDLARASRCDQVWHLERGRLAAAGEPSELLRPGSATRRVLDRAPLIAAA
jgi:ABC-type multidrug transport system fused ATPase/permease subunit